LGSARLRRKSSESTSTLEKRSCCLRLLTNSATPWRAVSASPGTQSSAIRPGRAGEPLVSVEGKGLKAKGAERAASSAAPIKLVFAGRLVDNSAGGMVK